MGDFEVATSGGLWVALRAEADIESRESDASEDKSGKKTINERRSVHCKRLIFVSQEP